MPWTCSALPFQPIRSFMILLFFSVLKNLWYGLWFHFVNEPILQWKIWWMLVRILVFTFYLDHWWCQQRELFRKLRILADLFGWLEAQWCRCDPRALQLLLCSVCRHHLVHPRVHRRLQCHAQGRVLRRPYRLRAPERDLAITNLGGTRLFSLISKSAVEGQLLDNGFALTEKSVMCLETQLLDFAIYRLTISMHPSCTKLN